MPDAALSCRYYGYLRAGEKTVGKDKKEDKNYFNPEFTHALNYNIIGQLIIFYATAGLTSQYHPPGQGKRGYLPPLQHHLRPGQH